MRFTILSLIFVTSCDKEPETVCSEDQTDFYDACIAVGCHAAITESESGEDTADAVCTVSCVGPGGGTVTAPKED